jgi:UDP-N-acetyl-2-amino-2-deoxyglucuronate dehydrogenase
MAAPIKNFALLGVGGYIAPRHLQAIKDVGGSLLCASDPNDSVGVLDRYFFETRYFREFERFDRHVEKLRRRKTEERIHYVSICSPNYLHDAHIRFALRVGAHAICEKPMVINPWNLEPLAELEKEQARRIYAILQLRVHPTLVALRERLLAEAATKGGKREVVLTYVTSRGQWYLNSWKGDLSRSGGIASNIGIHFFDLLLWLFGRAEGFEVHASTPQRMAGYLELERATVRWLLSIDRHDLPFQAVPGGPTTFRSITVDGAELEFSDGFGDLHTRLYKEIVEGRGFGIEEARPAIALTHGLRNATPVGVTGRAHERLGERR